LATAFLLAKGGSWPIPFLPSVAGARLRPCPPHPCSSKNPALVFFSFLDGVKVALLSSFLRRVRWSLSPFVFLHSCVKDRGMQGPRPSLDLFLFSLFLCLFFFQRVVVASLLRDKGMFMSTLLLLLILLLHLCQEWEGSHPPSKIKRENEREVWPTTVSSSGDEGWLTLYPLPSSPAPCSSSSSPSLSASSSVEDRWLPPFCEAKWKRFALTTTTTMTMISTTTTFVFRMRSLLFQLHRWSPFCIVSLCMLPP